MTKLKSGADGTPETANTGQHGCLPIDVVTKGDNNIVAIVGAGCIPIDLFLMEGAATGVAYLRDDVFTLVKTKENFDLSIIHAAPRDNDTLHADDFAISREMIDVDPFNGPADLVLNNVTERYVGLFGASRRKLAQPEASLSGLAVCEADAFGDRQCISDSATGGDDADQLGDDGSMPDLLQAWPEGGDGRPVPAYIAAAALGAHAPMGFAATT